MSTSLEDLDLGVRIERALKRNGISTLEDLMALTPRQLSVIRGLGEKTTRDVLDKLSTTFAVWFSPSSEILLRERPNDELRKIFTVTNA